MDSGIALNYGQFPVLFSCWVDNNVTTHSFNRHHLKLLLVQQKNFIPKLTSHFNPSVLIFRWMIGTWNKHLGYNFNATLLVQHQLVDIQYYFMISHEAYKIDICSCYTYLHYNNINWFRIYNGIRQILVADKYTTGLNQYTLTSFKPPTTSISSVTGTIPSAFFFFAGSYMTLYAASIHVKIVYITQYSTYFISLVCIENKTSDQKTLSWVWYWSGQKLFKMSTI